MTTISHRELRNNSGEVLRRVAAGEAFEVSNHGDVVARLVPAGAPDLPFPVSRPARRTGGWDALQPIEHPRPTSEMIDEERKECW